MTHPVLEQVRRQFVGQEAWIVGGAVRDRLLGRSTEDLDVSLGNGWDADYVSDLS